MSLFKSERLANADGNAAPAPRHSILIVDDELGNLRVLRSMLADRFRVLEASDGRQALEMLESMNAGDAPSIILSDQRMPNMTGVELFERVRELLPASIRIIITGFVDVGAIVDAINRAGIYKFVVKPFDRHDLLITVDRALEAFEMRKQIDDYINQLETKVRERTQQLEERNEALKQAFRELEQASLTDPLTGLGNRRFLSQNQDAPASSERRSNSGSRTAFLLIDVDHFKSVNDHYGHQAGDSVLTGLAGILRRHCREDDIAVRWGGEEFLMRVAVDNEAQALRCADRVRSAVAGHAFDLPDGQTLQRSCSIGVALLPFDPSEPTRLDWQRVLSVADAALYIAKRGGRNAAVCLRPAAALPADFEARLATETAELIEQGVLACTREPA